MFIVNHGKNPETFFLNKCYGKCIPDSSLEKINGRKVNQVVVKKTLYSILLITPWDIL